jgi:hypothetical protein
MVVIYRALNLVKVLEAKAQELSQLLLEDLVTLQFLKTLERNNG